MRDHKEFFNRLKRLVVVTLTVIILIISVGDLFAQEPPPVIDATVTQSLIFGAFTTSLSTGSVTISSDGTRTTNNVTGLFGFPYSNAILRVSTNRPTLLSIVKGLDVPLTRAGGGSMTLQIGDPDLSSPFLVPHPPGYVLLNIGGTLLVGDALANPPGSYSGTFDLTFIWE
jgi:hypothetical protein